MKQHPIPQNILDIEFKLFTKFTVKEFVYIAVGVGFGGIFLYFYSRNDIPGIIVFPVFLISSGLGLFLGLVPVNDQKADTVLRNYILAITKPTQRVWKNPDFDEKVEAVAEQRGITITKGTMKRPSYAEASKGGGEIIGGMPTDMPKHQFIEQQKIEEFDRAEEERLNEIDQIALNPGQTSVVSAQAPTNPLPNATTESTDASRVVNLVTTSAPLLQPNSGEVNLNGVPQVLVQPTQLLPDQPIQPTEPTQQPAQQSEQSTQRIQQTAQQPVTVLPTPEAMIQTPIQSPPQTQPITITTETSSSYSDPEASPASIPNSISLKLSTPDQAPLPQAMIIIRDSSGKIVQVHQSDASGSVPGEKSLVNGEYTVEVEHDKYNFPRLRYILEGATYPTIKLNASSVTQP